MSVLARFTIAVSILVPLVGCITDELAVYEDSVVGKDAAKAYVGVYQVEEWPGDIEPETVRVTWKGEGLRFAYSVADKKVDLRFVLSKIPKSKNELYLLSIPGQEATKQANMFFIGRAEKENTHIWAVFSTLPVARDHLEFTSGKAKAEDVKTFLMQHADEFVSANEPQVTLKHIKN
ncbi:MAG: hypothetical protein H6822_25610 [Planctomycetaceae bacterium]|nr:hypothetical protein [Planctomycetaceae bacterium]